jgi:hypothetical protein
MSLPAVAIVVSAMSIDVLIHHSRPGGWLYAKALHRFEQCQHMLSGDVPISSSAATATATDSTASVSCPESTSDHCDSDDDTLLATLTPEEERAILAGL